MNITSKRLDKIKKTKNQSKRRIHYKNKKKNGKEKNRRNNRKYNKSTGKYRKTHKRKKRAYDLKNKSLKFKENQPVNKSATLKIITTDKPVETLQTGGGGDDLWMKFKELFEKARRVNEARENVPQEETITYRPLTARVVYFNPDPNDPDTAVMSTDTSVLKTTNALVDLGNFKQHVTATQEVVNGQPVQTGGEIYDMMLKYNTDKTATQWNDGNWVKLGKKLAGLIETASDKEKFLTDLNENKYGEALLVANAMAKVLEKIGGENKMRFGYAYANNENLGDKIATAMKGVEKGFNLKAIIRGTKPVNCEKIHGGDENNNSVGHYDSFVKIEDNDKYVYFDAIERGTLDKDGALKTVDITTYLPNDPSCKFLIFLFNNDKNYPTTENIKDLQVTTAGNGKGRCWINATLYAVLFGIMNKGKENSEEEGEGGEEEGGEGGEGE